MRIGAQLYTVREHCKTLDDFSLTLKRIADIGYEYVQVSGTCAYDASWLKAELEKNGLSCVLTHVPSKSLIGDIQKVVDDHEILGCNNIGLGYFKFESAREQYEAFCRTYTPVAEAIAERGKYFMFHNHATEFIKFDNRTVIEHLSESFSSSILGFTLDTYWAQVGGADPARIIESLSGRVPCIHLKDCAYGQRMSVLGEGNINFDRVFEKAEKSGTRYMLVEQDDCAGEDPFECLKRSYAYLRSRGFK